MAAEADAARCPWASQGSSGTTCPVGPGGGHPRALLPAQSRCSQPSKGGPSKGRKQPYGFPRDSRPCSQGGGQAGACSTRAGGPSPSVRQIATQVDTETGGNAINDLYDQLYVPTSTYFVHANPACMLRHLKADRTLADRRTHGRAGRRFASLTHVSDWSLRPSLAAPARLTVPSSPMRKPTIDAR